MYPSSTEKGGHERSISSSSANRHLATSSSTSSPSHLRQVSTVPPWAQDDPPSPDEAYSHSFLHPSHAYDAHPGLASTNSFHPSTVGPSTNWWMFGNRSRNFPAQVKRTITSKLTEKDRSPWTSPRVERSLTWLTHSSPDRGPNESDEAMRFELPMPVPTSVFTVAQTQTPGWDAPWSPSRLRQSRDVSFNPTTSPLRNNRRSHSMGTMDNSDESNGNGKPGRTQRNTSRRKQIRNFILNNSYVPLLFRVINLSFTAAALAVAVRIRHIESQTHLMGAVGSSPTLVIIFAPLTIVHVIWAIYLEYFGRPLGLWRTSAKLMHTLSETLFICAWSAALSLCFDNIFTSPLQCTPRSATSWYSEISPQVNPITQQVGRDEESGPTDSICDGQSALIALVAVGLFSYLSNLVISLFRIFEKVKYHTHSLRAP